MHSRWQAELVRRRVRDAFVHFGADEQAPFSEALLIRGGFFCGRRFDMDGLSAVWFLEENQLKFYRRGGELIEVASAAENAPLRAAA